MALDFGSSSDPHVQAQLDRLATLSVPQGRIGLETVLALLDRMGNPQRQLPPVFHVAGTNGKGSTCAFLRAMLEAQGYRVHATTSPHLVRYNERIRVAGTLIADDRLAALLAQVLDAAEGLHPSFFEVTIAAAFTEFARVPADACIVEVGLGGRFDATNVLGPDVLAACGIAALGIDHERFLLAPEAGTPAAPLARIAFEKAGIAKAGVPLVTMGYPPAGAAEVAAIATRLACPLIRRGEEWDCTADATGLTYRDRTLTEALRLPLPSLPGPHQPDNAGLALAMLRHQGKLAIDPPAMAAGITGASWPARLQRLHAGPLTGQREVWLDGGHNPNAGAALGQHFAGQHLHLIIGMIAGKDPRALLDPMAGSIASITAVPVPAHEWHPAAAFGAEAMPAPDVPAALTALPDDGLPVLIAGSLYLAGEVLQLNGEIPD